MRTRVMTVLAGAAVVAAALAGCGSNTKNTASDVAATHTSTTAAAAHAPAPADKTVPTATPAPTTHAPVVNAPIAPRAVAPVPEQASAPVPAPAAQPAPAVSEPAPAAAAPAPSAAELNGLVTTALDPNVPATQKESLVQGGEQDPALFTQLGALRAQYPTATATVVGPVTTNPDGTVSATTQVGLSGQTRDVQLTFVDDGGSWKLSRTNACHFIALAGRSSPMCA